MTVLLRSQNGVFPEKEVETVITGPDAIPAHGSDEMPVWGLIFGRSIRAMPAKARIKNLVARIRSIQQR